MKLQTFGGPNFSARIVQIYAQTKIKFTFLHFSFFFSDLPVIPRNVQIRQQKNNLFFLTWYNSKAQRIDESTGIKGVRYLVEERHLLGPRYLESRSSPWIVRHVSSKSHATIRERLKTGHWYQFRVAAINANGSRGYSEPSKPFKTKGKRYIIIIACDKRLANIWSKTLPREKHHSSCYDWFTFIVKCRLSFRREWLQNHLINIAQSLQTS